MWRHAAIHSFGLPRPQVLFCTAAPCQYPRRPRSYQRFLPSWRIWHLSLLKSHWFISSLTTIFSNFFQLLHFQLNTIGLPHLLCSWGFSISAECLSSYQTLYSWSLFLISSTRQPGSSTNAQLLQVTRWSPKRSAFRLPSEPCQGQGLLLPRCSCLTFPNQKVKPR